MIIKIFCQFLLLILSRHVVFFSIKVQINSILQIVCYLFFVNFISVRKCIMSAYNVLFIKFVSISIIQPVLVNFHICLNYHFHFFFDHFFLLEEHLWVLPLVSACWCLASSVSMESAFTYLHIWCLCFTLECHADSENFCHIEISW